MHTKRLLNNRCHLDGDGARCSNRSRSMIPQLKWGRQMWMETSGAQDIQISMILELLVEMRTTRSQHLHLSVRMVELMVPDRTT